jgi:hypothetical protein
MKTFQICRTINLTGSRLYSILGGHYHVIDVSVLSVLSSPLFCDDSSKAQCDPSRESGPGFLIMCHIGLTMS